MAYSTNPICIVYGEGEGPLARKAPLNALLYHSTAVLCEPSTSLRDKPWATCQIPQICPRQSELCP
jgi:hypothetical protein